MRLVEGEPRARLLYVAGMLDAFNVNDKQLMFTHAPELIDIKSIGHVKFRITRPDIQLWLVERYSTNSRTAVCGLQF